MHGMLILKKRSGNNAALQPECGRQTGIELLYADARRPCWS